MREVLGAPDFENVNPGAGATEEDPLGGWAPALGGSYPHQLERRAQEAAPPHRSDLPPPSTPQISG